ncbi:MAG: hypothetical protein IIA03_12460, partial [Proteobacteria bacterium]|nr:hypothetical protein [Pseudomonadota bacterium]
MTTRCDLSPVWAELQAHFAASGRGFDIRDAFQGDAGRFDALSLEAPEVFADITTLNGVSGVVETFHCSSMTFLSPPLGTGLYNMQLAHGPSGN